VNGNQNYIESIGINQDGEMVAIIRTNQKVVRNNKDVTHVARTVVDVSEIPLNGLSNAAQADKIQETYNNMLPYWSKNFAGREPQKNFQGDINVLGEIEVEEGPLQGPAAPAGQYVVPEAANTDALFPAMHLSREITPRDWNDMSKQEQRNFIYDEVTYRNRYPVEFNGRQRTEWEIMTPTERKNEIAEIRNELRLKLKIEI